MGVYRRPDSKYYWMFLEHGRTRCSTSILIDAPTDVERQEQRQRAERVYILAMNGDLGARPQLTNKPHPMMLAKHRDEKGYFDLKRLSKYSGLSRRTLWRYMADPNHPLPNHHVRMGGKKRGRILVSKRQFDAWVATFPSLNERLTRVEDVMDARLEHLEEQ